MKKIKFKNLLGKNFAKLVDKNNIKQISLLEQIQKNIDSIDNLIENSGVYYGPEVDKDFDEEFHFQNSEMAKGVLVADTESLLIVKKILLCILNKNNTTAAKIFYESSKTTTGQEECVEIEKIKEVQKQRQEKIDEIIGEEDDEDFEEEEEEEEEDEDEVSEDEDSESIDFEEDLEEMKECDIYCHNSDDDYEQDNYNYDDN